MEKCFFSVIVPVYNAENYLDRTINSVLAQTFKNFELICIDDCSTDKSKEIIRKWQVVDGRIRLRFNESNCGPSFTRNVGLNIAIGQYIVFVDSDDVLEKCALATLYHHISVNSVDVLFYNTKEIPDEEHGLKTFMGERKGEYEGIFSGIFQKFCDRKLHFQSFREAFH